MISSYLVKWENEAMPIVNLKTLKVRIYPTKSQKAMLDKFIDTSRYVYNKTVEHIRNDHPANFQSLRDLLVTTNTQKHLEEYKAFDGKEVEELRKLRNLESQSGSKRHDKHFLLPFV